MKKINEQVIESEFDEFGIRYPDGEVVIVDDLEEATEAIRCAKLVVPEAEYFVVVRHVYITEWADCI